MNRANSMEKDDPQDLPMAEDNPGTNDYILHYEPQHPMPDDDIPDDDADGIEEDMFDMPARGEEEEELIEENLFTS